MQINRDMSLLKEMLQLLLHAIGGNGASMNASSTDGDDAQKPPLPIDIKTQFNNLKVDIVSTPRKYFMFVLVCFLVLYALFGDYGIVQRLRLEYHYRSLQSELAEENKRTKQLQAEIRHVKEIEEIERIAREKYNLTKEGETVYIIKQK
ncbi:Septum formation initiator [Chloroherpeton thalassium ATCC 35110]|uniref:Septum formation initiator n=1 Tax=Chloroherpeton thalassium (strain ATCC 35110 / GB-78) TaxID=517418 RepID=B3QS37_CHLT3|nr:septum formation initiator family protein [Chloroherpeton thalassium]ACF13982.1 Septum formation initiator [Chloroherpeton thalassium ATCC 35110]